MRQPGTNVLVVRQKGGLGNQLFIYAFGRALAIACKRPVAFDLGSGFERDFYRQRYSLHPFAVKVEPASPGDCYKGLAGRCRRRIDQWAARRGASLGIRYVEDPEDHFVAEALSPAAGRCYFDGYWQSPLYFDSCASTIREELRMNPPDDGENLALAQRIAGCDAIAVHARRLRGQPDLTPREDGSRPTASLPSIYYRQAVENLLRSARRPELFCFADHPDWFADLRVTGVPVTVVRHNRDYENSWKDLWLMQQCRFHVIADSTFSWWSAWLSERAGKRVAAPVLARWNWKANRDILPGEWQQIDW